MRYPVRNLGRMYLSASSVAAARKADMCSYAKAYQNSVDSKDKGQGTNVDLDSLERAFNEAVDGLVQAGERPDTAIFDVMKDCGVRLNIMIALRPNVYINNITGDSAYGGKITIPAVNNGVSTAAGGGTTPSGGTNEPAPPSPGSPAAAMQPWGQPAYAPVASTDKPIPPAPGGPHDYEQEASEYARKIQEQQQAAADSAKAADEQIRAATASRDARAEELRQKWEGGDPNAVCPPGQKWDGSMCVTQCVYPAFYDGVKCREGVSTGGGGAMNYLPSGGMPVGGGTPFTMGRIPTKPLLRGRF